jgi:hypothetical protein
MSVTSSLCLTDAIDLYAFDDWLAGVDDFSFSASKREYDIKKLNRRQKELLIQADALTEFEFQVK